MFRVCHVVLSVHCSLVVTCWERDDLLALVYVMFYCVFSLFYEVWHLIVSIPDICLLLYFVVKHLFLSLKLSVLENTLAFDE